MSFVHAKNIEICILLLQNTQHVYIIWACKSSRTFVKNRKGESKLWEINRGFMLICNHCKAL